MTIPKYCFRRLTCFRQETQILLDPLPAESRKRDILTEHGMLLFIRVIQRHVCLLMRDVEPELL